MPGEENIAISKSISKTGSKVQCFHKRNIALRTWRSKALQWGKCGLLSKMRPKCRPVFGILRTWVVIFIKIQKFFKITVHDSSFHALVVLLVSRASPKHSLHPASCFPAQLLVCYFQLCNQALIWGICGLSSEMRPKCGPFPQFRILRVESNLGNKVMDGTLHLLRRHLNQHHDTPRSSMDCAYTLKL